jgi:benzoyl-CoA reductase subunit D
LPELDVNTVGIDCGAKSTNVLILSSGDVLAKHSLPSGFDQNAAAGTAYASVLREAGLHREDIAHITATGAGREETRWAHSTITEVSADARAVQILFPSARTVIDVGAEEGRAIRINEAGKIVDFAINDKCAAGSGTFLETIALILEVDVEEMGPLSLKSDRVVPMKAQCAVFAESEVISLIHGNSSKADIARAVHDAIAERTAALARKAGFERDVVLVGGMARNIGFVESLERILKEDILIPADPEFTCALGAAMKAADKER